MAHFFILLTNGFYNPEGLPLHAIGPFPTLEAAGRWYNAHDPGDWEGSIDVIFTPE